MVYARRVLQSDSTVPRLHSDFCEQGKRQCTAVFFLSQLAYLLLKLIDVIINVAHYPWHCIMSWVTELFQCNATHIDFEVRQR